MGRPKMTEEQLRESLITRFHAGYERGENDECWLWAGPKTVGGYGTLGTGKRGTVLVHRIALELAKGDAPTDDAFACHECDVRLCVNPGHLYWGNIITNNRDIKERGNAIKETCRRGHPKTPENTYERVDSRGYVERHCIPCRHISQGVENPRPGKMTDTHCRNGHALAVVGVYTSGGRRRCKACVKATNQRKNRG